ncbi:MAG: bifunctional acetate--CoA ligase family protein/GNAT family N-acetyltransferase [Gammaproteobacteria bacterium]|nr:bifunctional acetate--CoA ligase family protein/GNAT family N-acetyltransferase [Gammaproteobacteria bacterium]
MGRHYLDKLFSPSSIAVFGASDRSHSVGSIVFHNLLTGGFKGKLYPVNPKHKLIQEKQAYHNISDIGETIDLAVIATPASSVPDIIRQCGEAGVHAAVVLSAGFGEVGGDGEKLQQQLLEQAQRYNIRIIGPNCLGIMRPDIGLNATFSHNIARSGHMALVSQSGALCTAMLDWAEGHGIGFSHMISVGDAADVDFGDILSYLALDPHTRSILLYVEGIHHPRSFISGLRIAARMKPVVVVKSGRHDEGKRVAMSHTGAMIAGDDVFHAALRRAGAVRAYTIEQLFSAAELLSSQGYRVAGNRLAIVTNGGGPGVMATDRAVDMEMSLATLDSNTLNQLNQFLPAHWSHGNPVDILGDADAERYKTALEVCLKDTNVDGVLVMLTPQAMTQPTAAAEAVIEIARENKKPVLACWMGGKQVAAAQKLFAANKIAHFDTPETSVEAFANLATYHQVQQLLMQVPAPLGKRSEPDIEGARLIIEEALAEDRNALSDLETMAVLKAFGIPVVTIMEARTANEALVIAESIGFPVVMKINSPNITHKSDVSGVRLNISSASTVRTVFNELIESARQKMPDATINGVTIESMYQRANGRELLIGVLRDPVFGPAISIGAGGTMVEIMKDSIVSLPPLNRFIAQRIIARTQINKLLGAFRQMPAVNMHELENVLLRVSELVCELPQIVEMDINPLIVDEQGALAVDARIAVKYQSATTRRYSHMAIHPYPKHLVNHLQLADGSNITIRPIRPEDATIEQTFIQRLSAETKYFRFMQALHELTPQMLVRFTQIDYDLEMALIAVAHQHDDEIQIGVARYATNPDGTSCEFAVVIADEWHHKGLGFRLMSHLMEIAKARDLTIMEGEVLSNNQEMLKMADKLGFNIKQSPDDINLKLISCRL